jgi:exodeoxyribonuclease-3
MKIYSWNINGIRSAEENLLQFLNEYQPDILLIQELRANPDQISLFLKSVPNYNYLYNDSGRPGYSGTAVYYKKTLKPDLITNDLSNKILNQEGRSIFLKFNNLEIYNFYIPNGNSSPARLKFKLKFYKEILKLAEKKIKKNKKIVIGGDLNVAHKEIDLFRPETASKHSGFLDTEREWFSNMISTGLIDSFREFDKSPEKYTWWNLRDPQRLQNKGWRLDYFLISENLKKSLKNAEIHKEVFGSDHCPVSVTVEI